MSEIDYEILLELAQHPQHSGVLTPADIIVNERNASCGDEVTVYLQLADDKQHVKAVTWEGHGCIISQASMSQLTAKIIDQQLTIDQVIAMPKAELEQSLGITEISPGRLKCLLLSKHAFIQAAEQLKKIQ